MARVYRRVLGAAIAAAAFLHLIASNPARAADPCGTSALPASCDPAPFTKFNTMRVGLPFNSLTYRDVEFPWDSLYLTGPSLPVQNTLLNLARTLLTQANISPVATDAMGDIQAVYNYFRREGANWNTTNFNDSTAFRTGWRAGGEGSDCVPLSQYNNLDRAHVDLYIVHPSRAAGDGQAPSKFLTTDEDLTSGRALGDTRHANSVDVTGPSTAQAIDEAGTGWTKPRTAFQTRFNHEMTHILPGDHPLGTTGLFDELLSAGAEAVGGVFEIPRDEFPYVRPLINEYQLRTAFMAYLTYNFLNADSSRTLAGMSDDLVTKWRSLQAGSSDPDWGWLGLKTVLSDANCATCQQKNYFRPGGVPMPVDQRLSTVMHNWRVAMFVNNPYLAEAQFGYPAWSGFSPNASVAAWKSFNGNPNDDVIALPSIATVGLAQTTQELTLKNVRTLGGGSETMGLQMLGANYWVVRAGSDIQSANRDLAIRIVPMGFLRCTGLPPGCGRLVASAVTYNHVDSSASAASSLWYHPEWVTGVTSLQWTEVDTVSGEIEVVVPNFGLTNKAAVLVLSLADGRCLRLDDMALEVSPVTTLPYRLDLSLRPAATSLPITTFHATAGQVDGAPAWSPDALQIAFHSKNPAVSSRVQIYRKPVAGGAAVRVAAQESLEQYYPDWSPRNDYIVYEGRDPSLPARSDIWRANATGGFTTPLTSLTGCATFPAFQPDGQGVAYLYYDLTSWSLRWVAIDGTGDHHVAAVGTLSGAVTRPRWSADGTKIYVGLNSAGNRIAVVPKSGGTLTVLPGFPIPVGGFDLHPGVGRPTMAPMVPLQNYGPSAFLLCTGPTITGARLAFFDSTATPKDTLYRSNVFGRVVDGPRYSPEGTRVAFEAKTAGGDLDLFVARTTTNNAPTLTNLLDESIPACVLYLHQLTASDPDGDPVTFEVLQKPPGSTLLANNVFKWNSPAVGQYYAIFRAIDSRGAVDNKVIWFNVFDDGSCGGFSGGGGGGGSGLGSAESGFMAVQAEPDAAKPEFNSLLDGAVQGEWANRIARLATSDDASGNVTLRSEPHAFTELDVARLFVVDHPQGSAAVALGSDVVVGSLISPAHAELPDGGRLEGLPIGSKDPRMAVESGTVIALDWPVGVLIDAVAVECARSGVPFALSEGGVDVQVLSAGGWRTVDTVHPRRRSDVLAGETPPVNRAQLVFNVDAILSSITGFVRDPSALKATTIRVSDVVVEGADDPRNVLASADARSLEIPERTEMAIRFSIPSHPEAVSRSLFLQLRARVSGPAVKPSSAQFTEKRPAALSLPSEFRLRDAVPNPVILHTALIAELPRDSYLAVEIFDPQGRRVRTVLKEPRAAGIHVLDWDGRNDAGQRVRPGLYLIRMLADGFSESRRVILVP